MGGWAAIWHHFVALIGFHFLLGMWGYAAWALLLVLTRPGILHSINSKMYGSKRTLIWQQNLVKANMFSTPLALHYIVVLGNELNYSWWKLVELILK